MRTLSSPAMKMKNVTSVTFVRNVGGKRINTVYCVGSMTTMYVITALHAVPVSFQRVLTAMIAVDAWKIWKSARIMSLNWGRKTTAETVQTIAIPVGIVSEENMKSCGVTTAICVLTVQRQKDIIAICCIVVFLANAVRNVNTAMNVVSAKDCTVQNASSMLMNGVNVEAKAPIAWTAQQLLPANSVENVQIVQKSNFVRNAVFAKIVAETTPLQKAAPVVNIVY